MMHAAQDKQKQLKSRAAFEGDAVVSTRPKARAAVEDCILVAARFGVLHTSRALARCPAVQPSAVRRPLRRSPPGTQLTSLAKPPMAAQSLPLETPDHAHAPPGIQPSPPECHCGMIPVRCLVLTGTAPAAMATRQGARASATRRTRAPRRCRTRAAPPAGGAWCRWGEAEEVSDSEVRARGDKGRSVLLRSETVLLAIPRAPQQPSSQRTQLPPHTQVTESVTCFGHSDPRGPRACSSLLMRTFSVAMAPFIRNVMFTNPSTRTGVPCGTHHTRDTHTRLREALGTGATDGNDVTFR